MTSTSQLLLLKIFALYVNSGFLKCPKKRLNSWPMVWRLHMLLNMSTTVHQNTNWVVDVSSCVVKTCHATASRWVDGGMKFIISSDKVKYIKMTLVVVVVIYLKFLCEHLPMLKTVFHIGFSAFHKERITPWRQPQNVCQKKRRVFNNPFHFFLVRIFHYS